MGTVRIRPWQRAVLVSAGLYNLAWGALVVLAPRWTLEWLGLDASSVVTRNIWACVGMIVGVYGIGYLAAARDPLRQWAIVLVGLLGKVLGPIGFLSAATRGDLPWSMGWTLLTNDLVWWIPFALLLRAARRAHLVQARK